MMGKTVNDGFSHLGVTEDFCPLFKIEVSGNQDRDLFIQIGQQLKEQWAGFGINRDVAHFINHNEMEIQQAVHPAGCKVVGLCVEQGAGEINEFEAADTVLMLRG